MKLPYHFMTLGISALIFLIVQGCNRDETKHRKNHPNVILILADDMGMGDLACLNGGKTRTPNLDRLVEESVWFSQAYSASPVCAPARAALLTGKYPHQTDCITLNMRRYPEFTRMDKDLATLGDVFVENGYATGLIGKWHCGIGEGYHPNDRGFQEFEGFRGYMVPSYFDYQLDINGSIREFDDQYLTNDITRRAIDFVTRHQDEPFFLHLAHYAPHRPIEAPQERVDHYLDKGFDENTATIYAMIEIMDRGIGKLIKKLDSLDIRENTLIVFSSDNGPDPLAGERYNRGLRGTKYTVYEGGIHVPFLVNWEGHLKPAHKEDVIQFTDVFPTLVDLCNLQLTDSIDFDGGSMAGVLRGKEENNLPERRYWQWNRGVPYYSHNAAIRKGKWKLVRPYVTRVEPDGESEQKAVLYNLEKDPSEKHDVSDENWRVYQNMKTRLEQWTREMEYSRLKED